MGPSSVQIYTRERRGNAGQYTACSSDLERKVDAAFDDYIGTIVDEKLTTRQRGEP
jgi:hypothetical protein